MISETLAGKCLMPVFRTPKSLIIRHRSRWINWPRRFWSASPSGGRFHVFIINTLHTVCCVRRTPTKTQKNVSVQTTCYERRMTHLKSQISELVMNCLGLLFFTLMSQTSKIVASLKSAVHVVFNALFIIHKTAFMMHDMWSIGCLCNYFVKFR